MAAGSILKYFKPVRSSSSFTTQTLPDLDGPLNEKVPAKAIELANAEVEQLEASPRGRRRSPYLILTPAQWYVACPEVNTALVVLFATKLILV